MSQFSVIQSRVRTRVIDLPSAVSAEVPTLINDAQSMLQAVHNWTVMRNEVSYITTVSNHTIGQVPVGWKEPRENPFYALQIGSTRELDYLPNKVYTFRMWDPTDPNSKGPPRNMLIGLPSQDPQTPDYTNTDMNLDVYPYPDGLSDWTTAPVGEYRITVPYWGYLPALVNNTDINWFTENATRFLIDQATAWAFAMNWDEQRAAYWQVQAVGKNFDGQNAMTLGGWARIALNNDKGQAFAPGRVLVPRRDVYAPRDQWRT